MGITLNIYASVLIVILMLLIHSHCGRQMMEQIRRQIMV
jgi:hypothetical protein